MSRGKNTSIQMHKRHLDLPRHHIAQAFGWVNKLVDTEGEHISSEKMRSGSK